MVLLSSMTRTLIGPVAVLLTQMTPLFDCFSGGGAAPALIVETTMWILVAPVQISSK